MFCLYQRHISYRDIITNNKSVLEGITVTNENDNQLFSIDRNLNIEALNIKTRKEIVRCSIENVIHDSRHKKPAHNRT